MKYIRLVKGSILFTMSLLLVTANAQEMSVIKNKNIVIIKKLIEEQSQGRIQKPLVLARVIFRECQKHRLDPLLVLAVMERESSFRVKAVSQKGAIGLMQIMPPTGRMIAKSANLFDPLQNTKIGIYYLKILKKRFKQNKILYLTAYNMGPNRLNSLRNEFATLQFRYAKSVLKSHRKFKARQAHLMKYFVAEISH